MKEKNKIIEELTELSATHLKNKLLNPVDYEIPGDYFQKMQEHVMSEIHLDLKLISNIKQTPTAEYFEKMQEEVLKKVKPAKIIPLPSFYKALAIAASFLVVFSFGYMALIKKEEPAEFMALQKNLTDEELNYILENYSTEEDFQYLDAQEEIDPINLQIQEEELDEKVIDEIMSDEDIDYLNELM